MFQLHFDLSDCQSLTQTDGQAIDRAATHAAISLGSFSAKQVPIIAAQYGAIPLAHFLKFAAACPKQSPVLKQFSSVHNPVGSVHLKGFALA
jgi:hypothetical protein